MKKQFHKIKAAAENLSSRSARSDYKDDEVYQIEKTVDKYKEVFEKFLKKFPPYNSSDQDKEKRDKRIKKGNQYKLGEALEESSRELPPNCELFTLLKKCGEMEKALACLAVDTEIENETKIGNRAKLILENDISEIAATKRNFSRLLQDYKSIKKSVESAAKSVEHPSKLTQLQMDLEQTETKVEKERDCWAAQMFDLIAKEEMIVDFIENYLLSQKDYHQRALKSMEENLVYVQSLKASGKLRPKFRVPLTEQLKSAESEIAYPIELAVCFLIENGLEEEGLLRVGCASTKLKRTKSALDARCLPMPLTGEYQDLHVMASILKQYLRELPEPLLTNKLYKEFISAAQNPIEEERKIQLKKVLAKLPKENYVNLRYLIKFLCLVVENNDKNKMNSHNVSIVMSPNLLWPPRSQNSEDYSMQMNSSNAVNTIVDDCITHYDFLFDNFEVEFYQTFQKGKFKVRNHKRNNSNDNNFSSGTIRSLPSDDSLNNTGVDEKSTSSPKVFRKKLGKSVAPSPPSKLPNSNFSRPHPQQQLQFQQMSLSQINQQNQNQAQTYQFDSQNSMAQNQESTGSNNTETPIPNDKEMSASDDEKIKQIESELEHFNNSNAKEDSTQIAPVPVPRPLPVPSPRTTICFPQKSDGETQTPTTIKPCLPEKPVIPKRPNLNNLLFTKDESSRNSLGSSPTNVFRYSKEFKEIPFIDTPTDSDHEIQNSENQSGNVSENATTPVCKPRTPTSGGTLKRPQVPAPPPPSVTPTSTTANAIHSSD